MQQINVAAVQQLLSHGNYQIVVSRLQGCPYEGAHRFAVFGPAQGGEIALGGGCVPLVDYDAGQQVVGLRGRRDLVHPEQHLQGAVNIEIEQQVGEGAQCLGIVAGLIESLIQILELGLAVVFVFKDEALHAGVGGRKAFLQFPQGLFLRLAVSALVVKAVNGQQHILIEAHLVSLEGDQQVDLLLTEDLLRVKPDGNKQSLLFDLETARIEL